MTIPARPEPFNAGRESGFVVFLSNYNHGCFIAEALDAILTQSLWPAKIHIVDDASTDHSRSVIEGYVRRFPDLVEAEFLDRNRGFAANFADWLARDDSEFVFIAAADDRIAPGLFARSIALLKRFPTAGLCSGLSRLLDETGTDQGPFRSRRPLQTEGFIAPERVRDLLLTEDGWFMGNTTIYRGAALRVVGFDRDLGAFADGIACRLVALRQGACFIPKELAYWRRMEGGMASQATASPAVLHPLLERAMAVMAASSVVPGAYPDRWRRRTLFPAVAAGYRLPRDQARPYLEALLMPLPSSDRRVLGVLRALPYSAARLLAFLWLRPFDIVPAAWRGVRGMF